MGNARLHCLAWLGPAAVATAIIIGFALLSHLAKPGRQGSPLASAETHSSVLAGVVRSTEGNPLTNAVIFISTAQPRKGPGFT